MASNGSSSVSVTAYDTLKFNWSQTGQSVANNTTTISWNLQLISGSAGRIESSVAKSWSVTVNGTTYSGTNSVAIENNTTKTLASGQTTITHNADGSKSFSYSFSQQFSITFAGASVGTIQGSGTGTLNTIVKATTPTLSSTSADMGTTITINTPRASSSFTHDIAYSFAGGAYISIANGVATSTTWTIPLTLASSIPNATNGTVTIRCITKSGGSAIGTKTVLLTAKVPTTVTPSISNVQLSEADTTVVGLFSVYVQNKSRVAVSISATGSYGSTIKSYSTTFQNKTYTGSSFTTDAIALYGTHNIVTTVTDSRGRTASKTTSITVQAYNPPKISTFHTARYNASGVADPDGVYAWVRIAYSVTSLNNENTATAKFEYKRSIDSTWSTLYTRTELSMNGTLKPSGLTFSTDYQYDFRITLTDAFNTSATYNAVLPSGAVILDIKADGKGIAFFKTCTKNGVEIPGDIPNSAISLTTGANLNSLTTPGFYVIPTTTISNTILNKPYTDTDTASIEVKRTGDGLVKQILQKSSKTDGAIYERGYDSSGWGAWGLVYGGAGEIIWDGSSLLTASQTVTFTKPISKLNNGIVLVFTRYVSNAAVNYNYSCHYVPKQVVAGAMALGQTAAGVTLIMATNKFEYISGKYLRITDTKITGDDANSASGSSNGVTYSNDRFALRYVIGV